MTDEQLRSLQEQIAMQFGKKVDVYHSEINRGVIVVSHGMPLHPQNIVSVIQY
jgi:hypothetical protein